MGQSLRDTLLIAATTEELVSIIYHGSSQPGTARDIRVVSIVGDEVHAHDIAAGAVKTFKLSNMELAQAGAVAPPQYDPEAQHSEDTRTIQEALAAKVAELQSKGWHVALTTNAIHLHDHFKNGKVRKAVTIGLTFDEFITDCNYDLDTDDFVDEQRKSKRPYHVIGLSYKGGGGFANLPKAITAFLEQVQKHPPSEVAG